ncbi:hypothetical protein JD974_12330 [Chromobacterium haemolyticum]|uniref:Arc-like DNA binding domain-containing protein n=1 Tax=Chromobacterium haemolyticum TaxID=394935 RepID=A0ABS3GPB5_9NEIS|nr:hypothetical protein [Chromobacterium haemolyticum]MBK0415192.1 hypothetical protein [Chromobacterium haemolyticum]MBO0416593.1 hypothetical protein [Chromobacterium haemolyticum]MBO0499831.1 hypothetical protein [Chromobacterium haemolyticum]
MVEKDRKDRFIIRFDRDTTRVGLKVMAAKNRRSMNDEILHLIDKGWEVLYGGKPGDEDKAA